MRDNLKFIKEHDIDSFLEKLRLNKKYRWDGE